MKKILLFKFFIIFFGVSAFAWDVDFTRRKRRASDKLPEKATVPEEVMKSEKVQIRNPSQEHAADAGAPVPLTGAMVQNPSESMVGTPPEPEVKENPRLKNLIATKRAITGDRQAFVILNTEKGFVPNNIRIYKGGRYVVHVVNINEQNKNVSFMLDTFNQHHSTFFGKIKSFELDPDKDGVFKFQCPETSAEGKIVVFGNPQAPITPVNRRLSSGE